MAEVAFRPARQLSEYKGKGASASREAEMDHRKLKHLFTPFSAFVASYGAAPKKCTSLPEQSVTLVPSTPRACKFTSLSYMKTNLKKKLLT